MVRFPPGYQFEPLWPPRLYVDLPGKLDSSLYGFTAYGEKIKALNTRWGMPGHGLSQILHHRRRKHCPVEVIASANLVVDSTGDFFPPVTNIHHKSATAGVKVSAALGILDPHTLGLYAPG